MIAVWNGALDASRNTDLYRRCRIAAGVRVGWLVASPTIEFVGVKDGFGVKQIKADGVPLLVDDAAGFYLIGSGSGVDDTNNIASFVASNNEMLRSMNGEKHVSLPYSFRLQPDAKEHHRIKFEINLGPAPVKLATVSMPVDGRRQVFDRLRYDGDAQFGNMPTTQRATRRPVAGSTTFAPRPVIRNGAK